MSDIEDDLLALAGADSGSDDEMSDVPLKRVKAEEESRQASMDEKADEDEEDDKENEGFEDEEEEYNDVDMDAEDDDDGDEDDLINPYPLEGKYRDEADREHLLEMDEIEREQTLFERSQEMDRYNEKKYLQQRMKQQKSAGVEKKTRSSSRKAATSGSKGSKSDKLSELRKQREQKSRKAADDYEEDEEDDNEAFAEDEDLEGEYDDGYEDEVIWGSGSSKFKPRSFERAGVEHFNRIRIGRSFLSKYLYYRQFGDVISKTFGKINVGMDRRTRRPLYRVVQIEELVSHPHKQYRLGDTKTDFYLVVSQNKSQTKEFPLSVFSDADITPEEFERYVQELNKTNEDVPYVDDINEKAEQLHQLMNSGLSNKDIDDMVTKKQKMQGGISSFDAVYQKSRVRDELKVAKQEGDVARVKELSDRLRKLEDILYKDTERTSAGSMNDMSKVNERNRKLNQTNIRKAELKSSHLRKTGELDEGDPFSRLKTTTRIFYQELVNEENQKALQDARANYETMMAEKNEQEAKIASSTYRELGNFDRLIAQVDIDFVPAL
ncbi:hypothetical protein CLUG_04428 [Clavispora lusitaniae ATCC 42720]|uniref:Plus3 domain-containing protein n=1 Tax=Clavispora lusitaniae (strain ATCC 42720) TaxID=306902 RepID=C4Y8A0_CLAL4|nr:uncharacterized protein CLUG_04428 [Clavispora lusitaniae ATCC 42720]EEQ40300.1 hypothetical protein CLUG_04428 [Clavispora lusitaniae ATCC 42720]